MSVGEGDLSSSSPTILHCLSLTLVCYHKLYVGLSPSPLLVGGTSQPLSMSRLESIDSLLLPPPAFYLGCGPAAYIFTETWDEEESWL